MLEKILGIHQDSLLFLSNVWYVARLYCVIETEMYQLALHGIYPFFSVNQVDVLRVVTKTVFIRRAYFEEQSASDQIL